MSKKKIDPTNVLNELKESSSFFRPPQATPASRLSAVHEGHTTQQKKIDAPKVQHPSTKTTTPLKETKSKREPSDTKSIAQSTDQFIDTSPILGKPKGFYITEKQNDDLDRAVSKLAEKAEGKTGLKIDRSTVLRLLLEYSHITDERTIESLYTHLVNRLVNRLNS